VEEVEQVEVQHQRVFDTCCCVNCHAERSKSAYETKSRCFLGLSTSPLRRAVTVSRFFLCNESKKRLSTVRNRKRETKEKEKMGFV
jgi:hypothetical protein